jgi:hypothetical protein
VDKSSQFVVNTLEAFDDLVAGDENIASEVLQCGRLRRKSIRLVQQSDDANPHGVLDL